MPVLPSVFFFLENDVTTAEGKNNVTLRKQKCIHKLIYNRIFKHQHHITTHHDVHHKQDITPYRDRRSLHNPLVEEHVGLRLEYLVQGHLDVTCLSLTFEPPARLRLWLRLRPCLLIGLWFWLWLRRLCWFWCWFLVVMICVCLWCFYVLCAWFLGDDVFACMLVRAAFGS